LTDANEKIIITGITVKGSFQKYQDEPINKIIDGLKIKNGNHQSISRSKVCFFMMLLKLIITLKKKTCPNGHVRM
jgi:hypothetical protein